MFKRKLTKGKSSHRIKVKKDVLKNPQEALVLESLF